MYTIEQKNETIVPWGMKNYRGRQQTIPTSSKTQLKI